MPDPVKKEAINTISANPNAGFSYVAAVDATQEMAHMVEQMNRLLSLQSATDKPFLVHERMGTGPVGII